MQIYRQMTGKLGQKQIEQESPLTTSEEDRDILSELVEREKDRDLRDVLHAQLRFRHELLPMVRRDPSFLEYFFQKPREISWSNWYLDCFRRCCGPLDIPETTAHYLQRWARQVLDPSGSVRVVAVQETGGLGLWNFGPPVPVATGDRLFPCSLDGLTVPTTAAPSERIARLFSCYQTAPGVVVPLVGPVSLLNQQSGSPFAFRTALAKEEMDAFQQDRKKKSDDRFWFRSDMIGKLRCVVVSSSPEYDDVATHQGNCQIYVSYRS